MQTKPPKPLLLAGAAGVDITPTGSVFLAGYPHVRRYSTGVHDPLLSTALFLQSGDQRVLIISNDVIYVSKRSVERIRERIAERTNVGPDHILISASHTHSGPKMLDSLATQDDDAVPKADPAIVARVEEGIVRAALEAVRSVSPAEIGLAVADASGVGTNRRDPGGVSDLAVPVLVVRHAGSAQPLAVMLVCSMHPTVLHEDSTLISGDFPGVARLRLRQHLGHADLPILYHTGPAGDQSPRHVTRANTFDEADRLADILADAVMKVIPSIEHRRDIDLAVHGTSVDLPRRNFPDERDAAAKLDRAVARLDSLRASAAPHAEIRTAEVDWFGAQETLTLARAARSGRVDEVVKECMPAEIQTIRIGPWTFVGWPGEMFVQFALDLKAASPNTFSISYANGELQGYLVTQQAVDEGGYESSNAVFQSPQSGNLLVAKTLELLGRR